ncbi:predicted protein [Aspergillus nidulans FGSC A4]|uniref:Uncharacterized protein n=1 Tax=Emericella nidulans (strain FGSC A4 / ATCC 38163 / CBS 112.46 / NRRL 194 / M139) TaxID=227321 RepID=Q5AXF6_EMENI|nr:hypothetical protein [Aspergillus nidulans FGSC A4]EAA61670.1 predicted protein [Aspergillus nidulans FGSC A4]CBF79238.1 TPA: hypothetical protein ANIA_07024 [Aspergillus nidulans FGSC A4]|eukprot:XP_664628.1 predicted protein [Aspergillus nidulans FGSC A4]
MSIEARGMMFKGRQQARKERSTISSSLRTQSHQSSVSPRAGNYPLLYAHLQREAKRVRLARIIQNDFHDHVVCGIHLCNFYALISARGLGQAGHWRLETDEHKLKCESGGSGTRIEIPGSLAEEEGSRDALMRNLCVWLYDNGFTEI